MRTLLFSTIFAALLQGCEMPVDHDRFEITILNIEGDVSQIETVGVSFALTNNYYGYPFDASGMTFKFPRMVEVEMELSLLSNYFDVEVSDPEARWGFLEFFGFNSQQGNALGKFILGRYDGISQTVVDYVYVDRPVKIMGVSGPQGWSMDADLTLNTGWNMISTCRPDPGDNMKIYRNSIPPGIRWRLVMQ